MRVIITKYCTTSGIQIREGDADEAQNVFRCNDRGVGDYRECFYGGDWYRNGDQAIQDVELRFARKYQSIRQQKNALGKKCAIAINKIQASGL